ncbi:hypothetical protein BGW38_003877 [Lunasporangiospora selenospora]|uniref:DUF3844 domain-containing protein n=1 Tax=Lunasporangiospora selenospora TaxID=979761 RepID=A0A9P6KCE2_9FUNG|nr:hypothetical protein BGW38_003877 [Lunasporangiospora selenospora]
MRLRLLSLPLSALALSACILRASADSQSSSAATTVYFFSHGRPSAITQSNRHNPSENNDADHLPSLSTQEARVSLSHLLNLGRTFQDENNVDVNGPIQQVFRQRGMGRKDLLETIEGNLVMVIEGVDNPQELMPAFDPAFTIAESTVNNVQDIVAELASRVPSQDRYVFNVHQSSKSGDALVNEHLVAEHHRNVDVTVFDLSREASRKFGQSHAAVADALFLEESIALENYLELYKQQQQKKNGHKHTGEDPSNFVRFTVKGLNALAIEHGTDSIQYRTAHRIMKELLQLSFIPKFEEIHKTFTTTIFLLSPSAEPTLYASELNQDYNDQQQQASRQKRALPVSSQTHCYETAVDCENATNKCSQHGACILSTAANCYHCKCSKVNTTQYGGPQCDKIDISIQFHLFFWLGLGLVMAVVLAVGLILQMGSQSEGGVPVGPTRAQLKRD